MIYKSHGIAFLYYGLKKQKEVIHFQHFAWPDRGIPATTTSLIYLRKMVNECHDGRGPVIVHSK